MAELKVMVSQICTEKQSVQQLRAKFPIKSSDDLIALDAEIEKGRRCEYVKVMNSLLNPDNPIHNIKNPLAVDFNIDGVLGNKSLKDLKHFYGAIIEAIGDPTAEQ